jgi:hypothetical protein
VASAAAAQAAQMPEQVRQEQLTLVVVVAVVGLTMEKAQMAGQVRLSFVTLIHTLLQLQPLGHPQ